MPIKIRKGCIFTVPFESYEELGKETVLYTQEEYEKLEGMLSKVISQLKEHIYHNECCMGCDYQNLDILLDENKEWYESYKNRGKKCL
jgi:hypothetical protein